MKDKYGREIEYLRISITDRCNLKCLYCSPDEDTAKKCNETLTPEEIEKIVRSMVNVGIRNVRITGGEPLVRGDVCEIIERISKIPGIEDISMTTNGINLGKLADKLKAAGLKRLNVSLDTLKKDRFKYITGGGNLEDTLQGIHKAMRLGIKPVKINTVLIKGVNDDEIDDLMELTRNSPLEVRFIELMPIGKFGEQNSDKIVYNSDIIKNHPQLIFMGDNLSGAPASYYRIDGYEGKVGFISPMSHKFCSSCNRIRLTSDGKIKLCLGNNSEMEVAAVLRENPQDLDEFIKKAIYDKPAGHNFENSFSSNRNMSRIGG